jgi:hypothetical protein
MCFARRYSGLRSACAVVGCLQQCTPMFMLLTSSASLGICLLTLLDHRRMRHLCCTSRDRRWFGNPSPWCACVHLDRKPKLIHALCVQSGSPSTSAPVVSPTAPAPTGSRRWLGVFVRYGFIGTLVLFKLLEWWYAPAAEQSMYTQPQGAVPPPPLKPRTVW